MREPLRTITSLEHTTPERPSFGAYRFQRATDPQPSLSGDLFDVLPTGDGLATICFGDASGHGFAAAMLSSLTRAFLRTDPARLACPARLIHAANRFLTSPRPAPRFLSLWVGSFDRSGAVSFVDAGHGHWFILQPSGEVRAVSRVGGIPLGIDPDAVFLPEQLDLLPGERLVLYSDGITEQRGSGGEEFGLPRLLEIARTAPPERLAERILTGAKAHAGAGRLHDDASVVVIERV